MLHALYERKIDWLTLTSTSAVLGDWLVSLCDTKKLIRTRLGRVRDFHGSYYSHPDAGRFFLGDRWEKRLDGRRMYLQSSGAYAAMAGKSLASWLWANQVYQDVRCTRIDVACDVKEPDFANLDVVCYDIATTHIRNNAGGETLYLGERIDEEFMRIYRKVLEFSGAGTQAGTWEIRVLRFEVEYKGRKADALFRDYCETGLLDGVDFALVREFAPELTGYLPDFDTCELEVISGNRREKPDTMAWLRGVVSGALLKMLNDHDKQLEVLDLLIFWNEQAKKQVGR